MKSNKLLQLIFIFIFGTGQLIAQNINTYFESQQTAPFQKLYLHTDREFYFTGDTLWFAAYLVEGQTNKPESESCNLYVDLINEEGEIVKDELFLIQNGFGSGYISFSDTVISEGNYLLRAYTDYLKNFGDKTFFTKIIQVSAIKNSFEFLTQDTIKTISPEIDVSFLPEGGFLLAEESNCVAFKAVDQSGKGKEISGKLLDEKGDLILTFKSVFKGAGKFYFYPKGDKKYTAKIDGYPNLTFQLPEIQETGAKIQLINQDESKIQMVVQGKNNNRNQSFYLVCSSRGEGLFYEEINQQKMNVFLKIDNEQLRTGINRFVLLDNNLNPISERLVFKEDLKLENIEIRLNNESFSTREEVQVNLKPSEFFVDEMAQVSISVIDENYVNASGVSQNIASYFLLDSELNGHIESPADYFISDEKLNTQTKLDLLMTTNGWSNYIWNSLKADSLKIEFERQLGFSFKGNVKRGIGNKALTEGNVFLMVKSDSTAQFLDMPLDENGNLEFRNIVFYDSASVFAQARNKRDNHRIQFEMQMPEIIPPEVNFSKLKQLQRFSAIPLSIYRLHYLNEMRLKEFHQDKNNILIQEIEVTAKKSRPKYRTGAPLKNHGPYLLTETMTAGTTNILEYLAYRVIGVRPTYDKISGLLNGVSIAPPLDKDIEINKGKVGFFLDEFMYLSSAQVMAYNVSDFKSIEIITPPGSNFYGARAINGAVILTFKDGDEIVTDRPLLGGIVERIKGFSPLREFYSPKYTSENINSEAPDYRNTLYWNPKVTVVNGEHELFFFTSDNLSRYKIFIEGITESGKICLGTGEFEVNNFRESSVDLMSSSLPAPSSLLKDTFNSLNSNIQVNLTKVYSTTKKKVEQMSPYSTSQYLQRNTLTKNHVSGTVQNRNFDPVEFATLYNISKETSCITNINGEFNLEATIGDSIRIQHLNYHTIEYIIQKPNSNYLLGKKDFLIDEVIVSPQFAFDLFSKSCENTYNSFKSENISRALCRFERKNGSNVSQIIYLDLDIIQKKQKNFKRGERIIPYKIQERIEKNPNVSDSTLELTLKMFYPLIHQIYWVDLPQHFSYYKKEDPIFIKLLLKSKLTYHYPCNMEVIIQKSDTTLKSFAIVKKDIVAKQERRIVDDINRHTFIKDTLEVDKTYHIIEYSYSDGFGYLSKYVQGVVFADPNDPQSRIEITQQLKTYNNGKIQLNKRPKQRRIFDNSFDPLLVKNRYEEIFWKTEIDWNKSP